MFYKKIISLTLLFSLVIMGIGCAPSTSHKTAVPNTEEPDFFTKSGCPDLIIDTIEIIKRSKNKATVKYVISNRGDAPAKLNGATKKALDNTAFKMYFSSDDMLNRGDILIGGHFIDDSDLGEDGILPPGYQYSGEIQISLKKKTSFTPILILNVDALQGVTECDETNNTGTLTL